MSQALHSGFDLMTRDPARAFLRLAPAMLHIDQLVDAFADALAQEEATGHRCFAQDGAGQQYLLTRSGTADESPTHDAPILFSIDTPDDYPLTLAIDSPEAPDRQRLARLHSLAVVFATHAVTLIEAEDDAPPVDGLTPVERQCLHLLLGGLSYLDIGEQLGFSAPATGVYLRRAAARLGVSSIREACAIAMARGLLT